MLGVHAAAEATWTERPRNRVAQVTIGGSKPAATTAKGETKPAAGAQSGAKRTATSDGKVAKHPAPGDDAGGAAQGKAIQPAPVAPLGVQRTAAAPTATVVSGSGEKLTLF